MEARLAEVGRRIDEICSRAKEVRDDTRLRVENRVNALRAREAQARSKAAVAEAEAWDESTELDRELDEIDIEVSIAEAQLDLDSVDDRASFEAVVERLIHAFRAYVELLEAGAMEGPRGARRQTEAVVESIRDGTTTAAVRLQRFRELSSEVSNSLRAGVLTALDDLD